jgi:hypothetical protein
MDDPFGGGGFGARRAVPAAPLQLVASTLATASDAWSRAPFPTPEALPSHCCGSDAAKRAHLEELVAEPGAALVRNCLQKSALAALESPPRADAPRAALMRRPPRRPGAGGRAGGGPAHHLRCATRSGSPGTPETLAFCFLPGPSCRASRPRAPRATSAGAPAGRGPRAARALRPPRGPGLTRHLRRQ